MTQSTASKQPLNSERLRIAALLIVTVGALLFVMLQPQSATRATPSPAALFDLEPWLVTTRCQAGSQPAQLEQMAQARMQRAVFVPSEALRATSLIAEAAQCWHEANSLADAERTHQQWLHWKSDLMTRFQGHRLRLDLALKNQRATDALTEISALKTLLSGIAAEAAADSTLGKLSSWLEFEQRRLVASKQHKK